MSKTEKAVLRAAMRWWRMHRPMRWSLKQHIADPIVNTPTISGSELAKACARHAKRGKR